MGHNGPNFKHNQNQKRIRIGTISYKTLSLFFNFNLIDLKLTYKLKKIRKELALNRQTKSSHI